MTITDDRLRKLASLRGDKYQEEAEMARELLALRQSSPPDGLDKDEQVAITEHLMMLADLDTEDAEHPPCTDFCGNRVCDQLGCVVWKYQRTHSIPTPSSETKA